MILLIFIFLTSCNEGSEFIYGNWEIGKENRKSKIIIEPEGKISWTIGDIKYLEGESFTISEKKENRITLKGGSGNDCFKLIFELENENVSILSNYKCYIDENMIDEVALARKNGNLESKLKKPKEETIILPRGYKGEFYIVYNPDSNEELDTVRINERGIGYSNREPQLKQLFNANRIIRHEGSDKNIEILNPTSYNLGRMKKDKLISMQHGECAILQIGINQSGRDSWNELNELEVAENINIEYFKIEEKKEHDR